MLSLRSEEDSRAAEDYRRALCRQIKDDPTVKELERFFTGSTFSVYTKLDGTTLMQALKDEAIACGYDYNKIKKSDHSYGLSIVIEKMKGPY